jgi:hypothetical protein
MRPLIDMLEPLASAVVEDDARHANAWLSHGRAIRVATRLPLVHRTCKSDAVTGWRELLATRRFAASEPCSGEREKAAGIPRAAYFFLGCGAYPEGLVGFVMDAETVLTQPSSYTPFDSGSIEKYTVPVEPARAEAWDATAKMEFLAAHTGHGAEVMDFASSYLAAHFRDPLTYVRHGHKSVPDFSAYHGIASTSGDRRAWTIEVQVHTDVPFPEGGATIQEIVAARAALIEELPDDLVLVARVAAAENEVLESIAAGIVARVDAEAA